VSSGSSAVDPAWWCVDEGGRRRRRSGGCIDTKTRRRASGDIEDLVEAPPEIP
jgi:hypothetical protein